MDRGQGSVLTLKFALPKAKEGVSRSELLLLYAYCANSILISYSLRKVMPLLRQEMAWTHPKVWWLSAGGLINHIVRSWSARYQLSSPSLHFSVEVGNIAIIDFVRQLAAGGCSAGCSAAVVYSLLHSNRDRAAAPSQS